MSLPCYWTCFSNNGDRVVNWRMKKCWRRCNRHSFYQPWPQIAEGMRYKIFIITWKSLSVGKHEPHSSKVLEKAYCLNCFQNAFSLNHLTREIIGVLLRLKILYDISAWLLVTNKGTESAPWELCDCIYKSLNKKEVNLTTFLTRTRDSIDNQILLGSVVSVSEV